MRVFSMYEPYSRAAPERRMLAFARVIPITPIAEMIAIIVTVIRSWTVENPLRVRRLCWLALFLYMALVMVQVSFVAQVEPRVGR